MNTADKSISMVDIALRRRLILAMYPLAELVKDAEKRDYMKALNIRIRSMKSIDFEIGHSDFMKNMTFADTLNKKTKPLLVEYFRNNMTDVNKILRECLSDSSSVEIDEKWFKDTGLVKVGIKK